jgi:hypothetical protein
VVNDPNYFQEVNKNGQFVITFKNSVPADRNYNLQFIVTSELRILQSAYISLACPQGEPGLGITYSNFGEPNGD